MVPVIILVLEALHIPIKYKNILWIKMGNTHKLTNEYYTSINAYAAVSDLAPAV
jgi:hypothetical protein